MHLGRLVLKVPLNDYPHKPPEVQFESEYKLLLEGLPPHRNVMPVFSHFVDESSSNTLPNWDLDPEFVMKRTSFIVMPFLPRDLAHALQSEKNAGNRIPADRARRIIIDILSAVQHLQAHRVAHCDLKPDNVMLQNVKTDHEVAVVTDFGCSKDFTGYDGHMAMPHPPGFGKGGSVMAWAPEVHHAVPGPGQIIDYSANDQFAAALIGHEIMAGQADHPFPGAVDPVDFRDEVYTDVEPELYDEALRRTVRELLRCDPAQRMTAAVALEELRRPLPAAVVPGPAPAPDTWGQWPGPLQEDWNPLYERVKTMCLFGDALDWLQAHPEARDYRSGGVTGWTMLHQAAYWMIPEKLLEQIRDTGASPLLLAQNYQQMQDGAGTFTPLEITKENETKEERKAWRETYVKVFGLGKLDAGTRGGGVPLWQQQPQPEPAPAQPPEGVPQVAPPAGDWKHCVCQATCPPQSATTYVLTASGAQKGASISMQPKRVPADPQQLWRLGTEGHLICQGGGFCVDIDGRNTAEFAAVIMWDVKLPNPQFPPAKNQMWVHAAGGTYSGVQWCANAVAQRGSATAAD